MSKNNKVEKPYLARREVVIHKMYNPKYGDDRMCNCGHPYYRHFDTYPDPEGVRMQAIGCKYCGCREFVEFRKEINR